jgi:hypothetical protein
MGEANVFDVEVRLARLPLHPPGEMRLLELLQQPGKLDSVGRRKEDLVAHGNHQTISPTSGPQGVFDDHSRRGAICVPL